MFVTKKQHKKHQVPGAPSARTVSMMGFAATSGIVVGAIEELPVRRAQSQGGQPVAVGAASSGSQPQCRVQQGHSTAGVSAPMTRLFQHQQLLQQGAPAPTTASCPSRQRQFDDRPVHQRRQSGRAAAPCHIRV